MSKKPVWQAQVFNTELHARWAVFFSGVGIRWIYQDCGYKLQNGAFFMPTFYLPGFEGGMFVEARKIFEAVHMENCYRLCQEQEKSVMLADGIPDFKVYSFFQYRRGEPTMWKGLPNADDAEGEDRMSISPAYLSEDGTIPSDCHSYLGATYVQAIDDAAAIKFTPRLVF